MAKLIEENKASLPPNMQNPQNSPNMQGGSNAQDARGIQNALGMTDAQGASKAPKQEQRFDIPEKLRDLQKLPQVSKLFNEKNKKRLIAIGTTVLALIIIVALIYNTDGNRYKRALSDFEKGDYVAAQEKFEGLGDYEDSAMWAADSGVMINASACIESKDYYKALSLMNDLVVSSDQMTGLKYIISAKQYLGKASEAISTAYSTEPAEMKKNYERALYALYEAETGAEYMQYNFAYEGIDGNTAKKYFKKCQSSDNEDVVTLSKQAKNGIKYAETCGIYVAGQYDKAIKKFKALGDYENASDMVTVCSKEKKEKAALYKEGSKLLEEKKYSQAFSKFTEAKPYKDAAGQADKCKQDLPKTGDYKKNGGSAVSLTISAPPSGETNNTYLKMYDSSKKLVGRVFIRKGESSMVSLPSGKITIKVAYGENWWGEEDLFGYLGSYELLTNEGEEVFTLSGGSYSLKLKTTTANGNVGSNSVSRGEF